ncbi:c-type cytochrome [Caulobacter sp.]|uniref:c-type cytochrome n=1 Tax=Caulobacter sp. TaxID=78 RepID=UPI0016213373
MSTRRAIVATCLALVAGSCAPAPRPLGSGAETFAHHDFGAINFQALNTVAVPWKLTAAALVLDDPAGGGGVDHAHLRRRMMSFGFLWPERLEGAREPVRASAEHPLGLNVGTVTPGLPPVKITVANLGCAACHAGPVYAADGAPDPRAAWLGAPNTSLDLEAYTRAVTHALKRGMTDKPRLLAAVRTLFPDTDTWEITSLRLAVIPLAQRRLDAVPEDGSPLPFSNGSPGVTNGVAALKLQGHTPRDAMEAGFTSVPELADRGFRSALLQDGAYAPPNQERWRAMTRADITPAHADRLADIVSFFTVPSMGQTPKGAHAQIPTARRAFSWLAERRPQTFPGPIDPALAARGADLYARACASCHGTYDGPAENPRLASFPNWRGQIGTDPARAAAFTPALQRYVADSPYRTVIDARHTGQYAAPPLSGVWSSAPYLHNGSVPTLAQLMLLESRAERFAVGGHALDFKTVGVAYPPGHAPWSRRAIYDTRQPGRSNRGHEAPFDSLSREDRWALIEYLKRL